MFLKTSLIKLVLEDCDCYNNEFFLFLIHNFWLLVDFVLKYCAIVPQKVMGHGPTFHPLAGVFGDYVFLLMRVGKFCYRLPLFKILPRRFLALKWICSRYPLSYSHNPPSPSHVPNRYQTLRKLIHYHTHIKCALYAIVNCRL